MNFANKLFGFLTWVALCAFATPVSAQVYTYNYNYNGYNTSYTSPYAGYGYGSTNPSSGSQYGYGYPSSYGYGYPSYPSYQQTNYTPSYSMGYTSAYQPSQNYADGINHRDPNSYPSVVMAQAPYDASYGRQSAYYTNYPNDWGYYTGNTDFFGTPLCNWNNGYEGYPCDSDPSEPVYDPYTSTWY